MVHDGSASCVVSWCRMQATDARSQNLPWQLHLSWTQHCTQRPSSCVLTDFMGCQCAAGCSRNAELPTDAAHQGATQRAAPAVAAQPNVGIAAEPRLDPAAALHAMRVRRAAPEGAREAARVSELHISNASDTGPLSMVSIQSKQHSLKANHATNFCSLFGTLLMIYVVSGGHKSSEQCVQHAGAKAGGPPHKRLALEEAACVRGDDAWPVDQPHQLARAAACGPMAGLQQQVHGSRQPVRQLSAREAVIRQPSHGGACGAGSSRRGIASDASPGLRALALTLGYSEEVYELALAECRRRDIDLSQTLNDLDGGACALQDVVYLSSASELEEPPQLQKARHQRPFVHV